MGIHEPPKSIPHWRPRSPRHHLVQSTSLTLHLTAHTTLPPALTSVSVFTLLFSGLEPDWANHPWLSALRDLLCRPPHWMCLPLWPACSACRHKVTLEVIIRSTFSHPGWSSPGIPYYLKWAFFAPLQRKGFATPTQGEPLIEAMVLKLWRVLASPGELIKRYRTRLLWSRLGLGLRTLSRPPGDSNTYQLVRTTRARDSQLKHKWATDFSPYLRRSWFENKLKWVNPGQKRQLGKKDQEGDPGGLDPNLPRPPCLCGLGKPI